MKSRETFINQPAEGLELPHDAILTENWKVTYEKDGRRKIYYRETTKDEWRYIAQHWLDQFISTHFLLPETIPVKEAITTIGKMDWN